MLDLASDPLLAIVAEGHELASLEAVSSKRLAEEPWLEADAVTAPVFARYWYFRDLRAHAPPVRITAGTLEEWIAEIAFVPVSDAPPSRLVLAWRRDDPPEVAMTLATFAARRRPAGP